MKRLFNIPNRLVAVTGGIASGKSTFCKELEDDGQEVFYIDKIVKRVYDIQLVKEALIRLCKTPPYGQDFEYDIYNFDNNTINFSELRRYAFSSEISLGFLERLTAPFIEGEFLKEYMERQLYHLDTFDTGIGSMEDYPDIYLEHALVDKMNLRDKFDDVIEMYAPEHVRIKRVMKRDVCTEEIAKAIIERQKC